MNFQGTCSDLKNDINAHKSAELFESHVDMYLQDECKFKVMYGPFKKPPFGQYTHVSPFITREKQGSTKRRVIVDLSWPREGSVNYYTPGSEYLGTACRLQYPTVDDFTERLIELGQGALMHKVDLSRAFRQLKVDPRDFPYLCLYWRDEYFCDSAIAFGYRVGGIGCSRYSDSIRFIHTRNGYHLMAYVDNMFSAEEPHKADHSFSELCRFLKDLRVEVNQAKLVPPTTRMNCLGIIVDSVHQTLAVPSEKLQMILIKCDEFRQKTWVSKKTLQSLIGVLVFITKAVKPARMFINRLLDALRDHTGERIPVTHEMRKDGFCLL